LTVVRQPRPRTALAALMLVDYYLWILHFNRKLSLDFDLGPLHVHLYGRAVFLMWVTIAILVIGGIAVHASRKRELIDKWASWMVIAPVFGIPIWIGKGPTAVVAVEVTQHQVDPGDPEVCQPHVGTHARQSLRRPARTCAANQSRR
jgi:hypothetical protein